MTDFQEMFKSVSTKDFLMEQHHAKRIIQNLSIYIKTNGRLLSVSDHLCLTLASSKYRLSFMDKTRLAFCLKEQLENQFDCFVKPINQPDTGLPQDMIVLTIIKPIGEITEKKTKPTHHFVDL